MADGDFTVVQGKWVSRLRPIGLGALEARGRLANLWVGGWTRAGQKAWREAPLQLSSVLVSRHGQTHTTNMHINLSRHHTNKAWDRNIYRKFVLNSVSDERELNIRWRSHFCVNLS